MKGISPKRIRERYINYLDPEINKSAWSIEEDITVIVLWVQYDSKWSLIR